MIDTLIKLGPYIVPTLLVIGWAVYVIWSKQEKLYIQRIANVRSDLESSKNEIALLQGKLDQPSELLASIEIMKKSFDEQLKKIENEKRELINLLESREEQNSETLKRIEDAASLTSWETFQALRHEARHITSSVNSGLAHIHHLLRKGSVNEPNSKAKLAHLLEDMEKMMSQMNRLFDMQKDLESRKRKAEDFRDPRRNESA